MLRVARAARHLVATARVPAARAASSGTSEQGDATMRRAPIGPTGLAMLALTGGGVYLAARYLEQQEEAARVKASQEPVSYGKALIGGPFTLVDQDGKPFTQDYLLGRYTLVYFGFTKCPDICPHELMKQKAALEMIDKSGLDIKIQPVFISVDPDRDSVDAVRQYIRQFHPRMVGATGSMEQVLAVTKAYRVYFSKADMGKDEQGNEDYLVDHSIIHYLMGPEGESIAFYGTNVEAEEMALRIMKAVMENEKKRRQKHSDS